MQTIEQGGARSDAAQVRAVIAVTRVWLGLGDARQVRHLPDLVPDPVLRALQAGERVTWQGWSINATPPRRIGLPQGQAEWVAGVMAVSAYGLVSGLRVAAECVQRLCAEIAEIEARRARSAASGGGEPELSEWELEDH